VVAGEGNHGEGVPDDFVLVRYHENGQLDRSFGSWGKVSTDFFGAHDRLGGIVLQRDGKILAAGTAQITLGALQYDFALARYTSSGRLDKGFGAGGNVTTSFFGNDGAAGVALQRNGKIVAAGTAHIAYTPTRDFAVARYLGR
jgi:uncharacterized delta-60 repeat protein